MHLTSWRHNLQLSLKIRFYYRQIIDFVHLGLNIYVAEFLLGMIGSKRDLKQGILGALTAGFNAKVLHPMKAGFNKLYNIWVLSSNPFSSFTIIKIIKHPAKRRTHPATQLSGNPANHIRSDNILRSLCPCVGLLLGMIGSKRDLKQGILGALTAGFNAKVLHPMKAGFNKLIAHGLTGGVRSRLSGGSKSGFLGSAVSYGASWSGA
jgi:hypothetical protein